MGAVGYGGWARRGRGGLEGTAGRCETRGRRAGGRAKLACAEAMMLAAAFLAVSMVSLSRFCAATRASFSVSATCVSAEASRERSRVASSAAVETSFT